MDKFIKFVVVFSLPFLFACSDSGTSSDNGGSGGSGLFGGAYDASNVAEVDTATRTMRYYYTAGCRSENSSFVWSDSLTGSELITYKINMDTLFWQYIPYIGHLEGEWNVMLGNGTSIYGTWVDTGCEIDSGVTVCKDIEFVKTYWKIENGLLTRTWELLDTLDAFRFAVRSVMTVLYGVDIFEDNEQDTLDNLRFSMSPASRTTGTFTVQDSVYSLRVSELLAAKSPDPLIVVKYSVGFGSRSCDYENSTYAITQSNCSPKYQSYYNVYDSGEVDSEMDIGNKAEFRNCLASMIGRPLFETVSRYFPKTLSRARGL